MAWVLIVIMSSGTYGRHSASMQEFSSWKTCAEAAEHIKRDYYNVSARCLRK